MMKVIAACGENNEFAKFSRDSILGMTVAEFIYHIGLVIYLLNYIFYSTTQLNGPSNWITIVSLCFIFSKVLLTSIEQKSKILSIALVIAIGILSWFESSTMSLFVVIAFVIASRNVSQRNIARVCFWTIAFGVSAVLVLCFLGVLPNDIYFDSGRTRCTLGFVYVGMLDLYLLHLALLAIYLKGPSLKLPIVALFVVLQLFAYSQSVVRGTICVALGVWALYFVFVKRPSGRFAKKLLTCVSVCSIPLCALIAFFTATCYQRGSAAWAVVNEFFSGRLNLAQKALATYGVTPFGQDVTWVGRAAVRSGNYLASQYNYVDSGYLQILIQFGFVSLALVCAAYIAVAALSPRSEKGSITLIWVIAIAIESLIYPNLLILAYNSLLLLTLGDVFSRLRDKVRK